MRYREAHWELLRLSLRAPEVGRRLRRSRGSGGLPESLSCEGPGRGWAAFEVEVTFRVRQRWV